MSNNTSYKDLYQSRYKEMAIALSPRQMAKRGSNNSKWFKTHLKMLLRLIAGKFDPSISRSGIR